MIKMQTLLRQKNIWLYGSILALGAFALQWLEYQYAVRVFSTEIYIVLLAMLFTGLGIWIGNRLTRSTSTATFQQNATVIRTLGLSDRELEVLNLLAQGLSNQEMADALFVSLSTIKTHLLHLYQKLDVTRRTQAVGKAKSLEIIS